MENEKGNCDIMLVVDGNGLCDLLDTNTLTEVEERFINKVSDKSGEYPAAETAEIERLYKKYKKGGE